MAAVRVKAPAKSMDVFSFLTRVSTRYRVTPTRERNPSGTLMKKIQRQEKYATMKPPSCRPQHACQAPDEASQGKRLRALRGRGDVCQHNVNQCEGAARPDALESAADDQKAHARGKAGRQRRAMKSQDRNHVEGFCAIHVGKLAEDGQRYRPGEKVGRIDPAVEVEAAELRDHRGHGGRHHQSIQRPEKQDEKRGGNDERHGGGERAVTA